MWLFHFGCQPKTFIGKKKKKTNLSDVVMVSVTHYTHHVVNECDCVNESFCKMVWIQVWC